MDTARKFNLEKLTPQEFELICQLLVNGDVGVIPTDTLYGLLGSALNPQAVERIYSLKSRTPTKPPIILISSIDQLEKFNITLDETQKELLNKFWPNKLSIILPCPNPSFEYLHRGTNSLAFRLPNNPFLIKLLEKTGPQIAPSANLEGQTPAETILEAQEYFKDSVDFYIDNGVLHSPPSTLARLVGDKFEVIRFGAVSIPSTSIV